MLESTSTEATSSLPLHIELVQVSVIDGSWQDEADNLGAFNETRLGTVGRGRGNLYILLDVSGELEGRAEVERELIETLRREYAERRGSITFGLSEALRAANAHLYQMNLSANREARRMAGISAVVLRGQDLYIAQAGPAVVYVEVGGKLARYPAESDWFAEDQPLYPPHGNASPPLGVNREFACDLFHSSVTAGDVFVLATRALTQLAPTDELAQAFENRGAEDIANYLEEIASGADLSALVAELVDPADLQAVQIPEPTPTEVEPEPVGAEPEAEYVPVFSSAAAIPFNVPGGTTARADEFVAPATPRQPRPNPLQGILPAIGSGIRAVLALSAGAVVFLASVVAGAIAAIDWSRIGAAINRALNMLFTAVWRLLALLVRLVLPGAPARQTLIPRRASKEPLWLKGVAVLLPIIFVGLAFGIYRQQDVKRDSRAAVLVDQARVLQQSAENNADKKVAREQLTQALARIQEARGIRDSDEAREVYYKIQDQLNEANGVSVLYFLPTIATVKDANSNLAQVIPSDNDLYFFDRSAQRVYHYLVNDSATTGEPATNDGVILKSGDKVGDLTVGTIHDIVWADASGANTKASLVALTNNALLLYNLSEAKWSAASISDASKWGDVRAVASFGGNVYLLDATKNQLWKYTPTANGYTPQSAPYFPANSGVSFSRAVDVAIDGDVWVLNSDGTLLRFRSGQRLQFELKGLDTPLKAPSAIFTRAEVDTLYIADAGNQRIVEFDKNGRFVHQFKPQAKDSDAFTALRSLFASESKRKFFFIGNNSVYLANMPK